MKYLKVFVDFAETIEPLSDAERGRLFTAMLEYAESGKVPDLRGNERILWVYAKQMIERQSEAYDKLCERNKVNATSRYQSLPVATSRYETLPNDATGDKTKTKTKRNKESISNEMPKKAKAFTAPSVEEVKAYCQERNNGINPQSFIDFYTARNWKLSSGIKMSDWRAAIRTWENRDKDRKPKKTGSKYSQHDISQMDFSAIYEKLD